MKLLMIKDADQFKNTFNTFQELIKAGKIQAGHDIGSGGLITTLLEMCFADVNLGAEIDLTALGEQDIIQSFLLKILVLYSRLKKLLKLCLKLMALLSIKLER